MKPMKPQDELRTRVRELEAEFGENEVREIVGEEPIVEIVGGKCLVLKSEKWVFNIDNIFEFGLRYQDSNSSKAKLEFYSPAKERTAFTMDKEYAEKLYRQIIEALDRIDKYVPYVEDDR